MSGHSTIISPTSTELVASDSGISLPNKGSQRTKVIYRYLMLALLTLIVLRVMVSVASGAGQNWDFVNFFNTGSRIFHGENANLYKPASLIAGTPALGDGRMDYVGFPLSAYVFAPLGAFAPRVSLLVFKLASAFSFMLALFFLFDYFRSILAPGWLPDQALSLYLCLILLYEPFWFVFAIGGQATPLTFLLLVLFFRSYLTERAWQAALYLSLAVLIKPFLALTAAILIFTGDWRLIKRLVLCFFFECLLSLTLFGMERHLEWIHIIRQEAARWAVPWSKNSSILGFAGNFWIYLGNLPIGLTPTPQILGGFQVIFKITLVALFIWWFAKIRRSQLEALEKRVHFAHLAILFPLLLSTVVWAHYLAFLFVPILYMVARYHRLPKGAQVLTLMILLATVRANWWPLTVNFHHWLTVNTFPETLAVGLFGSGALILTLVFLLIYGRRFLLTA